MLNRKKNVFQLVLSVYLYLFPITNIYARSIPLVILHTNDIHGYVLPQKAMWMDTQPLLGGFAAMKTCVESFGKPRDILFLDAGDMYQGTPEGSIPRGKTVVDMMNRMGYDAVEPGNHDYDDGILNAGFLAGRLNMPVLASNVFNYYTGKRPGYLSPYTIRKINDIRVGIIGVLTSDMYEVTLLKPSDGMRFDSEVIWLKYYVNLLKNKKDVDIVIVLSHCGVDKDKEFAHTVPGIDIIVGGHSHTGLIEPLVVDNTIIVQTYGKATTIGVLKVWVDTIADKILDYKGHLESLFLSKYPPDPEMESYIRHRTRAIRKEMDRVIGKNLVFYNRASYKYSSSPLGNWITDVMREAVNADISFQNKTGIRDNLPEGEVKLRDVYSIEPFGNTLVTMEITGKTLHEIVEYSLSEESRFLEASGIEIRYDTRLPSGKRIKEFKVNGAPLDLKKAYKVVTNNFLAQGGDEHTYFKDGNNIKDTGILLREVLINRVKQKNPVTLPEEDRISPDE